MTAVSLPPRFPCRAALGVLLLSSFLSGCRDRAGAETAATDTATPQQTIASGEPAASDLAITVTDQLDRSVSFATTPQRIISLTPSITEVLFGIEAGERIVGATKYCNYPAAADEIPRVGGGTLESLNQEKIVALEPDLVICKWDNHQPLLKNLERLGIPVLALGPETLADLYAQTRLLGRVTGQARRADALVEAMQQRVAAVVERIPAGDRPKVFYQVWDEPLMTAGGQSFIGELVSLAGGQNLFEDAATRYPKVNPEVVVAGNPDVILAPSTHATPVTVESILTRPGWSQVRAIQERRVHTIDRDKISRCGPRLVDALEEMAKLLYPQHLLPASLERQRSAAPANEDREP